MDLELSDDQLELRATINAVLTREAPVSRSRAIVEHRADGDDLWNTFAELGWPALTIAEEHGGIGLGAVEAAVLCEELGRVIASTPLFSTISAFVPLVEAAGSPRQQSHWLTLVASGTCRGTVAIAESGGSYDLARTEATAVAAGDGYRLQGTKRFAIDAAQCDVVACTVVVDGRVAVAVVDTAAVTVAAMHALDESRSYCDIVLDGTTIPAERLLRDGNDTTLLDALEHATVGLAMETVGLCSAMFDITLEYAKQREQFGVPIGSFQALKHKFADLVVALERARSLGYFAALCIAEHDERRHVATAAAKAAAGDAQRMFSKEGIQIHGGIGYTWEHDMHLYVRRAKTDDQLFGTAAMQRARVADLLDV